MTSLENLADAYNAQRGFGRVRDTGPTRLSQSEGIEIADYFDKARHDPRNPIVRDSYAAFKNETFAQWNFAKTHGIRFEPTAEDPYPNLDYKAMRKDLMTNHRLKVYTGGNPLPRDHPLSEMAPNGFSYNVIFRAVHDLFGHAAHNNSFSSTGEFHAFLSHAQMYSPRARGALAFETMGQTNWFDYGPHLRRKGRILREGERGYIPVNKRPYPPQKANVYTKIPPQWFKCSNCGQMAKHSHGTRGCCGRPECHNKYINGTSLFQWLRR